MLERRSIVVDRLRLEYLEQGTCGAEKPPMLLLHGLIASAETFTRLLAELPEDGRVIALDLLAAEPLDGEEKFDVSFGGLARTVRGFCAAVGLDRPVLLGHSHGGALALQIVAAEPEFATALILLCPAHPFSGHEDGIVAFYLSATGRALAHAAPRLPRPLQFLGFRRMLGPSSQVSSARFELYRASLCRRHAVARVLRLLTSWRGDMEALRGQLSARPVRTPSLLLWGDRDSVVPEHTAAALQRHLVQSQLVVLPGIGHILGEESPAACGMAIRQWLEFQTLA